MLKNVKIGHKLTIGFGLMILLTLGVVALSHYATEEAIVTLERTGELRMPVAAASASAQTDLLEMTSNVRGYLALGDQSLRDSYYDAEETFQQDIDRLQELSPAFDEENQHRLEELTAAFEQWKELPEELFLLYEDQMKREPAYAWLNNQGAEHFVAVQSSIRQMMDLQVARTPNAENLALLRDMSQFQSSFTTMFSGLRGYVTTQNQNYRSYEYEANLSINDEAWDTLVRQQDKLTDEQQALFETIEQNRNDFLEAVPSEVFAVMDSEEWRKDLFLFRMEAVPIANTMQGLLEEMNQSQQTALQQDLSGGRESLNSARNQTVLGGGLLVLIGIALAVGLGRAIIGPVRRLTDVAAQVRGGDLTAVAPVESRDEIGAFAETFNDMTEQLREQMEQIHHEKQRAAELQDEIIRGQKALLHELSTPLFPLADEVVAMPLIGSIDSTRAEQMMDTLLRGVSTYKARIAILDITGVPVVDTQVANALVRTAQAVRLLGTQVILTGIRAEVAQALVTIGADLRSIATRSTFQDGIAYAMELNRSGEHY